MGCVFSCIKKKLRKKQNGSNSSTVPVAYTAEAETQTSRTVEDTTYDYLLKLISVDYNSQELQDLQFALRKLLTRLKARISDSGLLEISRIIPCGSMVEKTAVWKRTDWVHKIIMIPKELELECYIEFDYLAVIEKPSLLFCYTCRCPLCVKVKYPSAIDDFINRSGFKCINSSGCNKLEWMFSDKLESKILSCDCMRKVQSDIRDYRHRKNKSDKVWLMESVKGCKLCTVDTASGTLQLLPAKLKAQVRFLWTSNSMSLNAPNYPCFQSHVTNTTFCMKHLPVAVDFIPAFERYTTGKEKYEDNHECFIISKSCVSVSCDDTWRISYCAAEIDHILKKMSDKHKKCYRILKYFNQQTGAQDVASYHLKTAILNHSDTCTNSSDSYQSCLDVIYKELEQAYCSGNLRSFSSKQNLIKRVCGMFEFRLNSLKKKMDSIISKAILET